MTIEVPERLEAAIQAKAQFEGVSAANYIRALLERELGENALAQRPETTVQEHPRHSRGLRTRAFG